MWGCLTPLQRSSQCILQLQPTNLWDGTLTSITTESVALRIMAMKRYSILPYSLIIRYSLIYSGRLFQGRKFLLFLYRMQSLYSEVSLAGWAHAWSPFCSGWQILLLNIKRTLAIKNKSFGNGLFGFRAFQPWLGYFKCFFVCNCMISSMFSDFFFWIGILETI